MTFSCALSGSTSCDCAREYPFARLVFLHDQTPDAGEETRDAFHAGHAPRLHLLQRPHEHFVAAERVGAVFGDDVVRIRPRCRALRHLLAVFAEDHSLVDQPLERLGLSRDSRDRTAPCARTRVEQMQHRVLGAADVEIDAPGCGASSSSASSPTKRSSFCGSK